MGSCLEQEIPIKCNSYVLDKAVLAGPMLMFTSVSCGFSVSVTNFQ